jgi:O-6-methylguanine DNA methyltransferase
MEDNAISQLAPSFSSIKKIKLTLVSMVRYNYFVDTATKLYQLTTNIPEGKVVTYGQLSKASGITNPRVVGKLLHKNPDPEKIPCHRVVNVKGEVAKNYAFGGSKEQVKRLEAEGVEVANGKVGLIKYRWDL